MDNKFYLNVCSYALPTKELTTMRFGPYPDSESGSIAFIAFFSISLDPTYGFITKEELDADAIEQFDCLLDPRRIGTCFINQAGETYLAANSIE